MPTIHETPVKTTDRPVPPPDVIPYFDLRAARYRYHLDRLAAAEGLPTGRWPA